MQSPGFAPARAVRGLALVVSMAFAGTALAQSDPARDFPQRPLRIMGQGVGSTADYLSRVIGQKLTERWGQPVVVEIAPGPEAPSRPRSRCGRRPTGTRW